VAGTFALRKVHGASERPSAGAAVAGAAWRRMEPREADRFLDIVIMISVALFMLLFTGVGILVLQHTTH
jgi:hypothetical protein